MFELPSGNPLPHPGAASSSSSSRDVELVLSGVARLRPFLHILTTSCKIAESVYLEFSAVHGLGVRAVSAMKSVHQLAVIPPSSFESFHMPTTTTAAAAAGMAVSGEAPAAGAVTCLIASKSLACSVLRYNPYLTRMTLLVRADDPDSIIFRNESQNGVHRLFRLPVQNGLTSEKAYVDGVLFLFEAAGEPKTWGSIFACLPASSHRVLFQPQRDRLTIRCADDAAVIADSSSSGGGAMDGVGIGSSVTADAKSFSSFAFVAPPPVNDDDVTFLGSSHGGGGGGFAAASRASMVSASLGPVAALRQQQPAPFTPLPGKIAEFKVAKLFTVLCEGLGLAVKLRIGGPVIPVQWEGVARRMGGGGGSDPSSASAFVSHISMIVASIDSGVPPTVHDPPPPHPAAPMVDTLEQTSSIYLVTRGQSLAVAGGGGGQQQQSSHGGRPSVCSSGSSMVAPSHVSVGALLPYSKRPRSDDDDAVAAAGISSRHPRQPHPNGSESSFASRVHTHVSMSAGGGAPLSASDAWYSSADPNAHPGGCGDASAVLPMGGGDNAGGGGAGAAVLPASSALERFPLDPDCFFDFRGGGGPHPFTGPGDGGGGGEFGDEYDDDAFDDLALQQFLGVVASSTSAAAGGGGVEHQSRIDVVGDSQHY